MRPWDPTDSTTARARDAARQRRAMATWPKDTRDPPRLAALRAHVERLPLLAEAG